MGAITDFREWSQIEPARRQREHRGKHVADRRRKRFVDARGGVFFSSGRAPLSSSTYGGGVLWPTMDDRLGNDIPINNVASVRVDFRGVDFSKNHGKRFAESEINRRGDSFENFLIPLSVLQIPLLPPS